ncbi:MAG: hypothetical protein IJ272_11000, partial [Clostridia bacterium]|nr:hypothetical protein [Clostridia bacterium]
MAIVCPRCGENSSVLDEHCKKCGFSIKNYLDNQRRFNKNFSQDSKKSESNNKEDIENASTSSSSICVMEKQSDSKHNNVTNESTDSKEVSKIENMESNIDSNIDNSVQVKNIFDNKTDEIQENILRILGNIKIVPDKEEGISEEKNN